MWKADRMQNDEPSICAIESTAARERKAGIAATEDSRDELEQYFTPLPVARLAVSLFTPAEEPVSLVDLGAGTGILSACFAAAGVIRSVTAVESDPLLIGSCLRTLESLDVEHKVICGDALVFDSEKPFDRAVLNPPYKKVNLEVEFAQGDKQLRVPNLYAAFMAKAADLLRQGGEMVAIIPRSWMSGAYYEGFRRALFESCSLDTLAILSSRTDAFSEFGVLQEICIVKLTKGRGQGAVAVADGLEIGCDPVFASYQFEDLLLGDDMAVATTPAKTNCRCLVDSGFRASTGKVVMHRNGTDASFLMGSDPCVPLIQPENLTGESVVHPSACAKKPQWLPMRSAESLLIPAGSYVLVRRFSPKEEKRRLRGYLLETDGPVAIENHINVLHSGSSREVTPLSHSQARALLEWVNSDETEAFFNTFASTTQVNAGDLNRLPMGRVLR